MTVGVDPNNQIYPITYAIVESETRETWTRFLNFLGEDLCLNNGHGLSWISDKQKGLFDAIVEMFSHSEHRYCVKHLHNNFKVHHKELLLKQAMWASAESTTEQRYDEIFLLLHTNLLK